MTRLQKYITDSRTASMLQEAIITQRDGRYVLPLRAEFKGRIKAIIHDQSSSGATLFIEPIPIVEANNEVRELQLKERDEERRVLAELSLLVAQHADEIIWGVEALAVLDLAFAKAKYAEELRASEPVISDQLSVISHQSRDTRHSSPDTRPPSLRLFQARHPLLDPTTVVAIDFDLPENTRAVVITGPNTGGKTVALKTVGLLALMAQSGLHIPAQSGSELPCFQAVYADIGDEQSIEQSLSTFSGHITNIVHILKKADRRALVILDELGAGTDPQEGSALARAILSHLLERGVTTFVATHYPELKTFAHSTPGVVNASLEFDLQTLRPTYHLTIGLPGRSNALAIAQRLGLPEAVVAAARSEINPDDLRADKLLGDIHRQRKIAFKESEKAEKARTEARRLERELSARLEKIEEERQSVLEQARAEGELEVEIVKAQLETLKDELKKARQPLEAVKAIEEQVELVEEKIQEPVKSRKSKVTRHPSASLRTGPSRGPLKVGERVRLMNLNAVGVIAALSGDEAEVQAGALKIRVRLEGIQRLDFDEQVQSPKSKVQSPESRPSILRQPFDKFRVTAQDNAFDLRPSPGLELDLRGQKAEDALSMLEDYLDRAFLAGMPFVRIIHGKGTGKLRQEVRAALKGHPHVKSFEEGGENEGGAGVTVAILVAG